MRLPGSEHDWPPLPVHQVIGRVDAVAVVAIDFARGVQVIRALVMDDRGIGQVVVDDRVTVGLGSAGETWVYGKHGGNECGTVKWHL